MIWFKSCSRCKEGDMTEDEDSDRLCLQCGYVQRSVATPAVEARFASLVEMGKGSRASGPGNTARRAVTLAV